MSLETSQEAHVREATPADLSRLFPALDASRIAFALVGDDDDGAVFGHEPFDSAVLGMQIGRVLSASARSAPAYAALFTALVARAAQLGYQQVLRRAPLASLDEIWALERAGFELMDVGLTFARRLAEPIESASHEDLEIRASTDADIERIAALMVQDPWNSRYESDPAYDASRIRELRTLWLWNSHRGRADIVLVGLLAGRPAGYVTCLIDRSAPQGEIELVGTLPGFRGRRVASRLLAHALAWFSTRVALVTVRTQATNTAAAALYETSGFTLHSSDLTFRLSVPTGAHQA